VPEVRIIAEPRTEFGKGGARRTRRAGKLPAVLYGHGTDPRHLSLPSREFEHALRTDGANVLLDLQLAEGSSELALPKSIQRDPIRGAIEHVDLILVRRGEKVTVDVAVTIIGEVVPDGLLDQQLIQIAVEAEATHIPTNIEVDVEGMEIGASVTAGDLTLPQGTTLAVEPDLLVLHVIPAPTAAQIDAEIGEAPAEGEAEASAEAARSEGASE
jgi:large subunit ribosomal protein L25